MNVIIVDDEKEACNSLKKILTEYVDMPVDIKGIAYNTHDAERLIADFRPDAILLDIEMPQEGAFDFLERIAPFPFEVIFVTAYDEYAVKAFKLNALDYILKPVSIDEVRKAIGKLSERLMYKRIAEQNGAAYSNLLNQLRTNSVSKIVFREANNIEIVEFKDIIYIEGQYSYAKVTFLNKGIERNITMSHSVAEYEQMLPAEMFYRIHKSYLVNCSYVTKIIKSENPLALVHQKYTLPVSRRRYASMMKFLKEHNFNSGF